MGQGMHTDYTLGMIIENMPQNKATINQMSKEIGELAALLAMQLGIEIDPNTISTVKDLENIFKNFNISIKQSGKAIELFMRNAQGISGSLKGVFNTEKLTFDVGEVNLIENRISALQNLQNTYKEIEVTMRKMSSIKPEDQQSDYYKLLTDDLNYYMQRLDELRSNYSKDFQVDFADKDSTDELVVSNRKIEAKIQELQAEQKLKQEKAQRHSQEQAEAKAHQENTQKVREYVSALQIQYKEEEKLVRLQQAKAPKQVIQAQQEVVGEAKRQTQALFNQVDGTQELNQVQDKLILSEKKHKQTLAELTSTTQKSVSLFGKFKETLKQVVSAGLSWKIFSAITQTLKKTIDTVKELDKSLVDLQIATGSTRAQAEELLHSYNQMAKELGATTQEIASAADSWLRQGYSTAQTNELIRSSMVLSKIGQIESAEATQYLTSALKGFDIEAEKSIEIVDKLATVDLISATSASGLAEALSRTAASANMAGVEMEQLLGYVAVVGETTQKSMSSIGESKITDALKVA